MKLLALMGIPERNVASRFAKDSLWVFVGQVTTSVTALVVMVVLANVLSQEVLGQYRFVISGITILTVFTLQGINPAIVQSVSQGNALDIKHLLNIKAKWGLWSFLVTLMVSCYFFFIGSIEYAAAFFVSAFFLPLYGLYFIYFFYLQGQKKFKLASLTHAAARIFFMIVILFVALYYSNLLVLVCVFMVATILGQFFGYKYVCGTIQNKQERDPELEDYAKEVSILGAFPLLAANIDKILVGAMLGPAPLAVYTIAVMFPQESFRIGRIISQVVLPSLSEKGQQLSLKLFAKRLVLFELLMLFGFVVYIFVAPPLFTLLFPTYPDAINLSVFAMLALLSMPLYIIRQFFIANKMKKELNRVLVYTPIVQTLILFVALKYYGLVGAIGAFVLGGFLELCIATWYLYGTRKR